MADGPEKAPNAFRTIGELSREIGRPPHILRYWETRFPQLKPLQRAGGRRYYRVEDVALVRRIDTLLDKDGYTMNAVQRLLAKETTAGNRPTDVESLRRIRAMLAEPLARG